jgi:hypothetical protein
MVGICLVTGSSLTRSRQMIQETARLGGERTQVQSKKKRCWEFRSRSYHTFLFFFFKETAPSLGGERTQFRHYSIDGDLHVRWLAGIVHFRLLVVIASMQIMLHFTCPTGPINFNSTGHGSRTCGTIALSDSEQ